MSFVLVADDMPESALAPLHIHGHEAVAATDASAVIAALDAMQFDVVVLDLKMPGAAAFGGGHGLARAVRARHPSRIVIASGAEPRVIADVCALVAAIPLPKPYLARDLVRAVTGDTP